MPYFLIEDPWRTVSPRIDNEIASIMPPVSGLSNKNNDPWAPQPVTNPSASVVPEEDEFAVISNRNTPNHQNGDYFSSDMSF